MARLMDDKIKVECAGLSTQIESLIIMYDAMTSAIMNEDRFSNSDYDEIKTAINAAMNALADVCWISYCLYTLGPESERDKIYGGD